MQTVTTPDAAWGWLPVFASLIMLSVTSGCSLSSFSVLYTSYIKYFDSTASEVGWALSIEMFVSSAASLVVSPAIERYGCRCVATAGVIIGFIGLLGAATAFNMYIFFLTIGVISGLGNGMCIITGLLVPHIYFEKKRALASGVSVIGFSFGQLVFTELTELLLETYGWRGSLLILSAVVLQLIPIVTLFTPLDTREMSTEQKANKQEWNISIQNEINKTSKRYTIIKKCSEQSETTPILSNISHSEELTKEYRSIDRSHVTHSKHWNLLSRLALYLKLSFDFTLLRNTSLSLHIAGTCLAYAGMMTVLSDTVFRAISIGFSEREAALVGSSFALGGVVSRILVLFPLSTGKVNLLLAYASGQLTGGVLMCFLFLAKSLTVNLVMFTLYGLATGCWISVQITSLRDLVGVECLPRASALLFTSSAFVMLVTVPFTGWLYDITGDYNLSFLVTGIIQLIGSLLVASIFLVRKFTTSDSTKQPMAVHIRT